MVCRGTTMLWWCFLAVGIIFLPRSCAGAGAKKLHLTRVKELDVSPEGLKVEPGPHAMQFAVGYPLQLRVILLNDSQ